MRWQRALSENALRLVGAENPPGTADSKPGAHGNTGEAVAEGVMNALMRSHVRIEIEGSRAAAGPHMIDPGGGKCRENAGEPLVKLPGHEAKIGHAGARQPAEIDAGQIIRRSANEIDIEVPVDIGAIGGQELRDQRGV